MFSTIIGHTRGLLPRKEPQGLVVTGVGDFDHTPPPSGRPSVDIPRKEDKGESITSVYFSGLETSLEYVEYDINRGVQPLTWSYISQALFIAKSGTLEVGGLNREDQEQPVPHMDTQGCADELPSWNFRPILPRHSPKGDVARHRSRSSQFNYSGHAGDPFCPSSTTHLASISPDNQEVKTGLCADTQLHCAGIPEVQPHDCHDNLRDSNAQLSSPAGAREPSIAYAQPSGRSQSLGSMIDYLWKSHWLKRLSQLSGSPSPVLTEISLRTKSVEADDRRLSEPVLPSSQVLNKPSSCSPLPGGGPVHDVDGLLFKRTFSDLERLVDEALSLTLEAADHSETSIHDNQSSLPEPEDPDPLTEPNTSPGSRENTEVVSEGGDGQSQHGKPQYRRAATYTAVPIRPRLADIVESYSGTYQELRTRTHTDRTRQESFSRKTPRAILPQTPSHAIKAKPKRKSVTLEDLLSTFASLKPDANGKGTETRIQKFASSISLPSAIGSGTGQDALPEHDIAGRRLHYEHGINLRKRSHVSLRDTRGFNLPKSHIRQPIARDWSPVRKRFVASVACLSTALIGVLLGIYTGLVPSIQYYIVDQSHVAIHGNTGCFLALALPSFFLWPLPLLHGRKPYIMSSLIVAMPLLFPQAIAVSNQRLTNTTYWRAMLLTCRTLMGGSLGFASMNFHSVLTDLFGASLMCRHPHQEVVDQFDARRHGGGMGIWLGIWTWCWIGSLGVGFLIGAAIIDRHPPAWGFYVSIILIAVVLILNVVCPEVRRSAFRRSIAEVRTGGNISRRLARGEVMMHRVKTGPKWWGQEAYHGVRLSLEMLEQPGFAVMAIYVAWIYAQIVLVIILMGSLVSRFYRLRSPYVGLHVAAVAVGALLAIPFQKASIFSRSRRREGKSNRETIGKKVAWSSHLIRRAIFTISLPIVAACYAAVSSGPPTSSVVPAFFALCMGFLSCLAISECNGLIMETFDTSDLSPGMVGLHRDPSGQDHRRTNYSSFPRVTAGFAIIHFLSYILAAGATALGGHVTRKLGQQVATSVVAGILFLLTVLLLLVLIRFKNVLIIPRSKSEEMERLTQARRQSSKRRVTMPNDIRALMEEDRAWRPTMTGNPMGKNRRMNVLEMGNLTRWEDIRRRNRLIDSGVHINREALDHGLEALDVAFETHVDDMRQNAQGFFRRGSLRRHGSRMRRSNQSRSSEQTFHDLELDTFDPVGTSNESSQQPRQFAKRDCVMGQAIKEEGRAENQAGTSSSRKDV
ncbi:major facilitator superfamily transporter [Fusarium langsethiae]|uniref:Major facilitator superfamily transporter n=1 Tax=Fusarium langsethiae TaxID=179993 RepID=A0A0M9F1G2_FUSLA|nr:major facilitator superfamily transporter [Fusarium langsethiae]GKT99754.1 unnamed protein product [Fusarium langsethiae]GKU14199.1 unnamed protein product [Fusarium langsethiae]